MALQQCRSRSVSGTSVVMKRGGEWRGHIRLAAVGEKPMVEIHQPYKSA